MNSNVTESLTLQSLYSYERFIEEHTNGRLRYHVAMVIIFSLPFSSRTFSFFLTLTTFRILIPSLWEGGLLIAR